jgi:UDP-N-acetylmuramoylalanine--D-glutamate ligase
MTQLNGQRLTILGLGASGIAAARLARRWGASVHVVEEKASLDEKTATLLAAAGITAHLAPSPSQLGEIIAQTDEVIVSPGLRIHHPWVQAFAIAGRPVIGELEFACRYHQMPMIAITGTNGKSTTTELIAAAISATGHSCVPCGNHGRPISDILLHDEKYDFLAVEVSSFQLETIRHFHPHVAIWTNFAADHQDHHRSMDEYFSFKARVFENQTEADFAIVKVEDRRPTSLKAATWLFSAFSPEANITLRDQTIFFHDTPWLDFSQAQLIGRHNAENVMAALAVIHALQLPLEPARQALLSYQPSQHRCEKVATHDERLFINDSKSTNEHSLRSALASLPGPIILIAGGKDKGLDYSLITPDLRRYVTHVIAIGEIAPQLTQSWSSHVPVQTAADMADAVQRAYAASQPGQTILLSPGTSSFDMYTGYGQRGQAFVTAVHELISAQKIPTDPTK